MYIEPCCAERQLGHLFREERGHVIAFQTSGDVTFEHWMKAVVLMSGDRPRTLTLAVPVLTGAMMRPLARYMRLEWIAKLRLMTTDPIAYSVISDFAGMVGCDVNVLLERIELASDSSIPDGMIAFSGPDGTVAIQGRIYGEVTPGLSLYAGVFGRTDSSGVRTIMDAWNANFKARRYKVALLSQQTEQPKKKKTTRKKNKNNETKPMETMAGTSQKKETREAK